MFPRNAKNPLDWQASLMNAITDPQELLTLLELDMNLLPAAIKAAGLFPLIVPRSFVARMQRGNPNDPLLRQVLPLEAETHEVPGYSTDPLQETKFNPLPGLLHKYHGRVLITFVGTCGINCRFCFRRHFPYGNNNPGTAGWDKIIEYIARDSSIQEVILSGGDPLVATDKMLQNFTDKLNSVPHIKRLRLHSRMPIVLPERITPSFIEWISSLKQKPILVVHCNHPQELSPEVTAAMDLLQKARVVLLNQTLLLKGINDHVDILAELNESLFAAGIQPYYLHVLDKVQGTAHYDLSLTTAQQLYTALLSRQSGYLVPKLACEQPGAPAKTLLSPLEFYTA